MTDENTDRSDAAADRDSEPAAAVEPVAEEMVDYADDQERDLPDSGPDGDVSGDGAPTSAEQQPEEEAEETELERAQRERAEYLDLAQRSRAELENYRRRVSGEAAGAEQRGRASLARDLIPAIDNLERALLAAGVNPDGSSPDDEPASQEVSARTALAEGVALVYRELGAGLKRAGVEPFDPNGERFDPSRHEAVSSTPVDGVERGQVIETLEKGYSLGEQVLRPARVIVSG
jgi:molecular chaperone GrpE